MKTIAAVLVETGRSLELAELSIPQLRPGQVLVEIAFSGVCHTQLLECRGKRGPDPYLPHCLGHEGSGTVVDVGTGVQKCGPGDRVILSWIKGAGADVPGTVYDWNGRSVNAGGVTTFARHAVVSENRITVLNSDVELPMAALIGCAVPTGMGAVWNSVDLKPGQSVAVFGTGGVGLCAVAAARLAGAAPLIAVDVSPTRLEVARTLGATDTVNASELDSVSSIVERCPGGVDFAIEASGQPKVMAQALASVRPRGGTAVIIGNAPSGGELLIDPQQLNQGKRLLGTWGGDNDPEIHFPRYCRLIAGGQLDLRPLVERTYSLTRINNALDDLESQRCTRPLIDMSAD